MARACVLVASAAVLLALTTAAPVPGLAETVTSNRAQTVQPPPHYPFKSAIINYELSGVKTGTKTVYIKGSKQEIEETGVLLGQSYRVIYLIDDESFTTINPDVGRGTRIPLTPELRKQLEQAGQPPVQQLVGQNVDEQFKKEVGKDKVLDRECSVHEALGQRICVWADTVPLRTEGNLMGIQFREVATKIEENVEIPDSRFEVPAGIQIQEAKTAGTTGPTTTTGKPPAGDPTPQPTATVSPAAPPAKTTPAPAKRPKSSRGKKRR